MISKVLCSVLLTACLWAVVDARPSPYTAYTPYLNVSNVAAAVQNASAIYGLGLVKDANASLLSQIIADAGSDFGLPEPDSSYDVLSVNQPIYAKAFADFIHQLQPNNQSALQQAFSDDVAAAIITRLTRQNARPDNTGPFIELAHATGEDSAFVNALQQVRDFKLTVDDVAEEAAELDDNTHAYLNANNAIDPSLLATFRAAAAAVFGFNPQTLQQAEGDTAKIAILVYGSALLAQGNLALAAQNLSTSVASAALTPDVVQQVYLQAVQQAVEHGNPYTSSSTAIAVLTAAALSAKQDPVIHQAFEEANAGTFNVTIFCNGAQSAKDISSAAEQAILAAIPSSFGTQPCK